MTFLNRALKIIFFLENFHNSRDIFFFFYGIFYFYLKQFIRSFSVTSRLRERRGGGGRKNLTELAQHGSANFNRFLR